MAALKALPPPMRAAFLRRAYGELFYQEIASALEVKVGPVKSRVARAQARLQEVLEAP